MAATTERTSGFLKEALAELRRSYSPSTEDDAWLVRTQLDLAREGALAPAILGPLAAIALAIANIGWVPAWRLVLWPVLFLGTGIVCGFSYERMLQHAGTSIGDTRRLAHAFTWLSFAQVAAWCAAAFIIWVPGHDANHFLIGIALIVSLTGWTALGTYHYATGLAPLPLFLAIMTLGSFAQELWITAAMILAYWVLMLFLFQSNYNTRRKMLMLERERARLIGDLTAAKHVSDSARDKAEMAVRAKAAFLANMSHELRTPLNAILGFSEIINTKALGTAAIDQYAEYGGYIHGSGKHLLSLINDILDLSRLDAHQAGLIDEVLDVEDVIDTSLTMIAGLANAAHIALSRNIAPNLPLLRADRRRVKQVLINLLANAVKFTPAGGKVSLSAALAKDGSLMLAVADTGIGIAKEDIPKALARFGQVDSRLSRRYEGAGLGLPLAKQLMELHDGSLVLESDLDVGTTVRVTFPPDRLVHRAKSFAA